MKSQLIPTATGEELQIGSERFRRCPGFGENYLISSEGVVFTRIRSKLQSLEWVRYNPMHHFPKRPRLERLWYDDSFWQSTFPAPNHDGYKRYRFSDDGIVRKKISELVLEAFVGSRPPGMVACHINGNASDDRLANLRWDTPERNERDKRQHGTLYRGEDSPTSTISDDTILKIVALRAQGLKLREVETITGVSKGHVSDICNGKCRDDLTGIKYTPIRQPISDPIQRQVIEEWEKGRTIRELRKQFGIGLAGLKALVRAALRAKQQ